MLKISKLGIAALLMGFALTIPTGTAAAWNKTDKGVTGLGTGAIANPTAPESSTSNEGWKGSFVYYGKYYDKDSQKGYLVPVKYRILNKSETKFTDKDSPTLFLDCDNMLYTSPFDRWNNLKDYNEKREERRKYLGKSEEDAENVKDNDLKNNWVTNAWEECTTRDYLNGYNLNWQGNKNSVFYKWEGEFDYKRDGVFSYAERVAIVLSKIDKPSTGNIENMVPTGLEKGDHIFLLDITDVENKDYGYGSNGARKKKFVFSSQDNTWWLRSPEYEGKAGEPKAGRISNDGTYYIEKIPKVDVGASPAFNVNLSSIVFSSLVSGKAGQDGAEYKLTLLDKVWDKEEEQYKDGMTIVSNSMTRNGNTVTVYYTLSGENVSNATQVSALVTNGTWTEGKGWSKDAKVIQYGPVSKVGDANMGTFTLDSALISDTVDTNVYILAENLAEDLNDNVKGEHLTDYASAPVLITTIPAKKTPAQTPKTDDNGDQTTPPTTTPKTDDEDKQPTTPKNDDDDDDQTQKSAYTFVKPNEKVSKIVKGNIKKLLPGIPANTPFYSGTDNMTFHGLNGLSSFIETIQETIKDMLREMTAVMPPVSVSTYGVYLMEVKVSDEQSKKLIGSRNLAYHIEPYEDSEKGSEGSNSVQLAAADADEHDADETMGVFVTENGELMDGDYEGGNMYLLIYASKAEVTYVQYMTAEADIEAESGSAPDYGSLGSGCGGCNAGLGGMAPLALIGLLIPGKRKKR